MAEFSLAHIGINAENEAEAIQAEKHYENKSVVKADSGSSSN